MVPWQCKWNRECVELGLLEESGAYGLKDLPKEVLNKIAECLDLATQVNLWETNKYLYRMFSGQVCFVRDFESTACSAFRGHRCHTEAFALCGIELLSHLPHFFDLQDRYVQVEYTDGDTNADTVDIRYLEDQNIAGKSDASMFQVKYIADTPDNQEDSDGEFDEEDRLLFRDLCHKSDVHKLLCSAPSLDRLPEVQQTASKLVLQSTLVTGSREDIIQCAQYCFELVCSRRWCQSKIFITFPPPSAGLDSGYQAMKIHRRLSLSHPQQDLWSLNNSVRRSCPVKLDFALFPQGAFGVEAYFFSHMTFTQDIYDSEYLIGTDLVRQQCLGFAQLRED